MKRRVVGIALNALLRTNIAAFLADTLLHPHDPRYEGKALPLRNLVVVGSLSLTFPLLYLWQRQRRRLGSRPGGRRYPVWSDNLFLSIFWLDMAGNYFDLYDRYLHFDLIPHAHGSGALGAVLLNAFKMQPLAAFGVANGIHGLLEAQEIFTDVFFGTHNVRGAWDSIGDLGAGLIGTSAYIAVSYYLRNRLRAPSFSNGGESRVAARRQEYPPLDFLLS
jgi:hypothetical protein